MYNKKKSKRCPFCRGKATKVNGDLECQNCGAVLNFSSMDLKELNMIYFSRHK